MKKATEYNHKKIEKKWHAEWAKKKTYKTLSAVDASKKKKKPFYVLDMFPYPSGAGLHVGHPRGYIGSDLIARQKRMQGFNVLHPMGFDSFGLPAEQYAIKTGKHPGLFTDSLVKHYKTQLEIIGFSYDWDRQISTHSPEYYKWTQWIFLKIYDAWYDLSKNKARHIDELVALFEKNGTASVHAVRNADASFFSAKEWKSKTPLEQQQELMKYRLAYEGYSEVNWCPELGTVLANDEIIDGPNGPVSERGEFPVEKKTMRQWFMRITAYGDRLLSDLDALKWPEHLKEIQRNWIGKSEGSEIKFKIEADGLKDEVSVDVFTTRADTLFGVTYVVYAPEHEQVQLLKPYIKNWNDVDAYIKETKKKDDILRASTKEKTGVELEGIYATNPATGEKVPAWIADYVLVSYGTGAVMAVPSHDERDFAFAEKYGLEKKCVIEPKGDGVQSLETLESFLMKVIQGQECYLGESGHLINSEKFDKMPTHEARVAVTKHVGGNIVTRYKFRDAIFARQRYWGEPIPLLKDKNGLIKKVPESKLPLKLPNLKSFAPGTDGQSPLSRSKEWVKAGYETNTMPGWAGSSWYFLRYMDPKNKKEFASKKEMSYWKNVQVYVGGQEHATGHLLYARFWNKALYDLGYVHHKEPFDLLKNQGLILGDDNRKMSKRWGNVVNPDDIVATYGADTLRVYEAFMGPFEQMLPWSTEGIIGSRRFLEKVWRMGEKVDLKTKDSKELLSALHKAIHKVSNDITTFNFNTAVSSMMIALKEYEKAEHVSKDSFLTFLQLLAPFAPFMTEELWSMNGGKGSIHLSLWPKAKASYLKEDSIVIGVQVNGKTRGEISLSPDATEEEARVLALKDEKIIGWIGDKEIKKFIYVKGRIVNIVIG